MDNNFNTAEGLASIFLSVREINQCLKTGELSTHNSLLEVKGLFEEWSEIFGVDLVSGATQEDLPIEIKTLVDEREQARRQKDWAQADAIRDTLKEHGYVIEDTAQGPRCRPI